MLVAMLIGCSKKFKMFVMQGKKMVIIKRTLLGLLFCLVCSIQTCYSSIFTGFQNLITPKNVLICGISGLALYGIYKMARKCYDIHQQDKKLWDSLGQISDSVIEAERFGVGIFDYIDADLNPDKIQ